MRCFGWENVLALIWNSCLKCRNSSLFLIKQELNAWICSSCLEECVITYISCWAIVWYGFYYGISKCKLYISCYFFSPIRLSHQPLQPNSLVGGGLDSASTAGPHPTLNSVQLPPEPMRQRQQQMRQQRLFQVRHTAALEARDISVQEGSVNITVSGDGVTRSLACVFKSKAAEPGAINPNCFYSSAIIHCLHLGFPKESSGHICKIQCFHFFKTVECLRRR